MQVNQEDYEDKLTQINRLNREVQALKERVLNIKHQRDTIMECLVEVADLASNYELYENDDLKVRDLIAKARAAMGQSEIL
jgi:prefoldin subunit 5